MLRRWTKVSASLRFIVHSIAINHDVDHQFKLTWRRGHYKGGTTRVLAIDHCLTFNESFHFKCTMYVSRPDSSVRPKLLKFTLKRFVGSERRVFGRLTIDIGPYFGTNECVSVTREMESGRSTAPVIRLSFQFDSNTGKFDETANENESSFLGHTSDSSRTLPWDRSAEGAKPAPTPDRSPTRDDTLSHLVGRKKSGEPRPTLVGQSSSLSEFIVAVPHKDYQMVLKPILEVAWPQPITQSFISMPYPYPSAVFPIFAAMMDSELLKRPNAESEIMWFCENIQKAPLSPAITNEKRFMTHLMLYILVRPFQPTFDLDPMAVDIFQREYRPIVDDALAQYARPLLVRFEPLLNRFATTQFELNSLLEDWQKAVGEVRTAIGFPAQIKAFVLRHVIATLDSRMADRMLVNPARFSFRNAMTWGSFLTALETAIGQRFVLVSQICQTIQMAPAICASPGLSTEVCPALGKSVILFILTGLVPDEMRATNIDASLFVSAFGLDPTRDRESLQPPDPGDYMELIAGIRIADWNACEISAEFLGRFPFLAQFLTYR
jgi:hypothetical protein